MSLSSAQGREGSDNEFIRSRLSAEGFKHFGIARLMRPFSIGLYEEWLAKGYQGEMAYLERHLPDKREPERLLKKARSAIVVTLDYVPHPEPIESFPLSAASRVALYARGRDYHHFLRARLTRVAAELKTRWPEEEFVIFSDSSPVLERDLAARAGLGWVGKNTCLLDRKAGSLFFIAEIYSTLDLQAASIEPHDHCGTCTRCLEACPTGALKSPRELDARLCISYLTIESRAVPEPGLREKIGDWLFGCDICQTVCPWNIKVHGRDTLRASEPSLSVGAHESLVGDLRFILASSNRALEKAFRATPLARAGGIGLKRNALIVAANLGLTELEPEVDACRNIEKLRELADWALKKLADQKNSCRDEKI